MSNDRNIYFLRESVENYINKIETEEDARIALDRITFIFMRQEEEYNKLKEDEKGFVDIFYDINKNLKNELISELYKKFNL